MEMYISPHQQLKIQFDRFLLPVNISTISYQSYCERPSHAHFCHW